MREMGKIGASLDNMDNTYSQSEMQTNIKRNELCMKIEKCQ